VRSNQLHRVRRSDVHDWIIGFSSFYILENKVVRIFTKKKIATLGLQTLRFAVLPFLTSTSQN
jgi:hypothetical protein